MPDASGRAGGSGAWSEAEVVDRLREWFAGTLNVRVPSDDTDLLGSGLLDSLGLVELLVQVEQAFGLTIELQDLELEHFRSINTIAATVAVQLSAAPSQLPPMTG